MPMPVLLSIRPGAARAQVHSDLRVERDDAAMIGYCDQAQGSNRDFYQHYREVGGHNGHFDFPVGGNHDWSTWGPQLGAMSGELVTTIK